eukprot:2943230-Prymnesium_polylepis.2
MRASRGQAGASASAREGENGGLQRPATACKGLQRPATACNGLQRPATACNGLQRSATACNGLQRPAKACKGLQRPAKACKGPQRPAKAFRNGLQFEPQSQGTRGSECWQWGRGESRGVGAAVPSRGGGIPQHTARLDVTLRRLAVHRQVQQLQRVILRVHILEQQLHVGVRAARAALEHHPHVVGLGRRHATRHGRLLLERAR